MEVVSREEGGGSGERRVGTVDWVLVGIMN